MPSTEAVFACGIVGTSVIVQYMGVGLGGLRDADVPLSCSRTLSLTLPLRLVAIVHVRSHAPHQSRVLNHAVTGTAK